MPHTLLSLVFFSLFFLFDFWHGISKWRKRMTAAFWEKLLDTFGTKKPLVTYPFLIQFQPCSSQARNVSWMQPDPISSCPFYLTPSFFVWSRFDIANIRVVYHFPRVQISISLNRTYIFYVLFFTGNDLTPTSMLWNVLTGNSYMDVILRRF